MTAPQRSRQHPRIKALANRYRNFGAAIYAGKTFTVARWENGETLEFRVETNINDPMDKDR